MKTKAIYYVFVLSILYSCTSDDSGASLPEEQGFSFEITGDITKTISGKTVFFSTSITQDIFDRDLHTLVISANDTNGDQVNIGITQLERVDTGNYSIAFEIEPPYNGFVNYIEDPGNSSVFGPIGGSIVLNAVDSEMVTGSIDAQCQIPGQTTSVSIKGTFKALIGSN